MYNLPVRIFFLLRMNHIILLIGIDFYFVLWSGYDAGRNYSLNGKMSRLSWWHTKTSLALCPSGVIWREAILLGGWNSMFRLSSNGFLACWSYADYNQLLCPGKPWDNKMKWIGKQWTVLCSLIFYHFYRFPWFTVFCPYPCLFLPRCFSFDSWTSKLILYSIKIEETHSCPRCREWATSPHPQQVTISPSLILREHCRRGETSILEQEDKVKDYRLPDSATIAIISC